MALVRCILVIAVAFVVLVHEARAQTPTEPAPAPTQPPTPPPTPSPAPAPTPPPTPGTGFEPPVAKGATQVAYPSGAPAHDQPIVVTVKILVDATGVVKQVDLVTTPQPPFDEAVKQAVMTFAFEPAKFDG